MTWDMQEDWVEIVIYCGRSTLCRRIINHWSPFHLLCIKKFIIFKYVVTILMCLAIALTCLKE